MAARKKAAKAPIKLHITPYFSEVDKADGGVRRVVEAQRELLPAYGFELVDDFREADILGQHIHDHRPSWFKENMNVPMVSHNHGLYWTERDYQWLPWATNTNNEIAAVLAQADAITAPSEWVAQILRRGTMKKVTAILHGVRMDEWPEPASYELSDTAGYVLWNKTRVDSICDPRPVSELADLAPGVSFLSTVVGAHGNRRNIKESGALPYEQAKVLVQRAGVYLATTRETFGIGTVEAMAAGVPILGWAWGGQAEFVENGVTGWLCAPGDIDGLAKGLEYCLRNRSRLGRAARSYVAGNLTWDSAIAKYASLYTEVLDEARPMAWVPQMVVGNEVSPGANSPLVVGEEGKGVSVVITCFKLERYLRQSIQSALDTLPGCEVIVVDDCSPGDGSGLSAADVVQATAAGPAVKLARTEKNLYLAGALNFGVGLATGDLIIPLDADNYLEPGIVQCVAELRRGKAHDIAYGLVWFIDVDSSGNEVKQYGSQWPGEFSFPAQIRGYNQIPSTSVYRKSVWERIGGYRQRCKTAEDADFWCRATSFCGRPVKATGELTFTYRNRMESMSHVEAGWKWNGWYAWSKRSALTPLGAALTMEERKQYLRIPTYEPVLVSVIIPVGPGHQRYLPDAIDSVVAQTFGNWELIIVNDTGTETVGWTPPYARVIDSGSGGRPSGTSAARNAGLAVARGRTFLFLDADDYLQPEALETLYTVWRRPIDQGGGGIVYGDFYEQGGLNQPDPVLHVWEHDTTKHDGSAVLSLCYLPVTYLAPMAAVGQGEGLAWWDESMDVWEDWDFLFQLHANGWCTTYVPTPIFNYSYNTGGRRIAVTDAKSSIKQYMDEKWGLYYIGHGLRNRPGVKGKTLMACSGCRGGGGAQWATNGSAYGGGDRSLEDVINASGQGEMVRVEYIGGNESTVEYRAPVSGMRYRFDATQSGKVNSVRREDVAHFVQWPQWFRLHGVSGDPALPSPSEALVTPAR